MTEKAPVARRRLGRPPASDGAHTRQALVRAASRHMARAGYEGMSLEAVASDVGVTKAAIYRYFASKRELALAVVVEDLPDIDRYYDELAAGASTLAERMRALIKACMRVSFEDPEPSLGYFQVGRLAQDVPELTAVFRKRSAGVRARISALVDEAVESGELDESQDRSRIVETVAGLLWAMTSGAAQAADERAREQTGLAVELLLRPAPWELAPGASVAAPPVT